MINTYFHHIGTKSSRLDIDTQHFDRKTPTGRGFSWKEAILFHWSVTDISIDDNAYNYGLRYIEIHFYKEVVVKFDRNPDVWTKKPYR